MSEPSASETLEHTWRYFTVHADQRMSLFNFFLIAEGTMAAGLAACVQGSAYLNLLGIAIGMLMAFVAFVFSKLDQRTAFLIKHAEEAIAEMEKALPAAARVVSREPAHSAQRTGAGPVWTYGEIFRMVFLVIALVGIGGSVLCVERFATNRSPPTRVAYGPEAAFMGRTDVELETDIHWGLVTLNGARRQNGEDGRRQLTGYQ